LLFCSFKKSDEKSNRSFPLSKRANEREMSDFPNRSFFAQKKEQLLIFKMNECSTLQLQGWAIAHSLIAHFCSFQKSN